MRSLLVASALSSCQLAKENHYACNTSGNHLSDNLHVIGQCKSYSRKSLELMGPALAQTNAQEHGQQRASNWGTFNNL
jgi:hypothetical protein